MHDQKKKEREEVLTPEQAAAAAAEHERVGALYKAVLHSARTHTYSVQTLEDTELLLLAVPEAYTAYNCRRQALETIWGAAAAAAADKRTNNTAETTATSTPPLSLSRQEWLRKELKLNSTVLLMNYKNYNAFVHRHWVFDQLEALAKAELAQQHAEASDAAAASAASPANEEKEKTATAGAPTLALLRQLLQKERAQCEQLLQLDERNFHAWNYRRWVLAQESRACELERAYQPSSAGASPSSFSEDEASELVYTTQKIKHNFSNYSAWHQRSLALKAAAARWQPYLTTKTSSSSSSSLSDAKDSADAQRACHDVLLTQLREDIGFLSQAIYCDPNDQSAWFYAPVVLQLLHAVREAAPASEGSVEATALTDALVMAVVELVAEVDKVGGGEESYMPYYFLLDQLFHLQAVASAEARAAVSRYTSALCEKVASLTAMSAGQADRLSCCFKFLHQRLCRADTLRRGLYDDMLAKAVTLKA